MPPGPQTRNATRKPHRRRRKGHSTRAGVVFLTRGQGSLEEDGSAVVNTSRG